MGTRMGTRAAWVALVLASASVASAQSTETGSTASVEAAAPGETPSGTTEAATTDEDAEPVPETPPGYETTSVPTPPARPTVAAPRRTTVVAQQATDDERAVAPAPPAASSDANVELALTINGLLSFGGLGGTTVPSLFGNADLVFAADPRVWIGLGIAFAYTETHSGGGFGVPDMKFVTSSIQVPVIFQYYFDTPHVGAAIPTLRVQVTPGWSETPVGAPTPSTQAATGNLTLLGGITWMAASWFALRIVGGLNGGFSANVVGPISITGNAGVQALISAVARF